MSQDGKILKEILSLRYLLDGTQDKCVSRIDLKQSKDFPLQTEEHFRLLFKSFYDKYSSQKNLQFLFTVLYQEENGNFIQQILDEEELKQNNKNLIDCSIFAIHFVDSSKNKNYFIEKIIQKENEILMQKNQIEENLESEITNKFKKICSSTKNQIQPEIISQQQESKNLTIVRNSKNKTQSITSFFTKKQVNSLIMNIKILIFLALSKMIFTSDFVMVYSNRSMNLIYNLLPAFIGDLKDFCKKDFKPIEITFGFTFIIEIEYLCINSIDLSKPEENSFTILNDHQYQFQLPVLNFLGTSKIKITKGIMSDIGIVKVILEKIRINFIVNLYEQDGNLRFSVDSFQFLFDKIDLEIENLFIRYIWKLLLDHDFIKNYIIKKVGNAFISKADKTFLNKLIEFELEGKKFLLGYESLPELKIQDDQHFIIAKLNLIDQKQKFVKQKNDEKLKNFYFEADIKKMGQILRLYQKTFIFHLNEIEAVKDNLTVKTLSVIFPELNIVYPEEPDKKILMDIEIQFQNEQTLIERDKNLFLFNEVQISMKDFDTKKQICELLIENFFNLLINSSNSHPYNLYINQPSLRIKQISSKNCLFEFNETNYIKILENLLKIKFLEINKISFEPLKQFLDGPFLYFQNDKAKLGIDVLYPFQ